MQKHKNKPEGGSHERSRKVTQKPIFAEKRNQKSGGCRRQQDTFTRDIENSRSTPNQNAKRDQRIYVGVDNGLTDKSVD
jgi:hypothetical protein